MANSSMPLLIKNRTPNRQTLDAMAETQATIEFLTGNAYKLTP
jgi:hypothetical protein